MAAEANVPPRPMCRTPDECFEAGWADGEALGERLSPAQRDRIAALIRPHLNRDDEAAPLRAVNS